MSDKKTEEIMYCGNCGCYEHNIILLNSSKFIIKCCKCENESQLSLTMPKIYLDWVGNHKGLLTC